MARKLIVEIVGDTRSLERAFKRSATAGRQFQQQFAVGVGGGLGRTVVGFTGITTAVYAAGRAARAAFEEFSEMQKVTAQTDAVLKSTGATANVSARHVQDLAGQILRYSGIDDEAVAAGENLLLTFKNIRNEAGRGNQIFDRATRAAADLSIAWGTDMQSAAIKLGKAINDPIRGLTALQRVGITFTEQQRKTIEALVDAGQVLEAQKIILAEVESQVGGSAKAYGETLPGQLNKATEQVRNLGGELVNELAPAMGDALEVTLELIEASKKLGDAWDKLGGTRLKSVLDETIGKMPALVKLFSPLGPATFLFRPPTQPVLDLANAWDTVGKAITNAARNLDPFRQAFADIAAGFAAAAKKFGPPPEAEPAKAFQLPGPLRLAEAQARITKTISDDLDVARAIRDHINKLIATGKLKGQRLIDALADLASAQDLIRSAQEDAAAKTADAARRHADAVKAAAERQQEAAREAAERLRAATETMRQRIGELFAPPDTAQRRAALGLTAGPDPRELLRSIREQNQAFKTFRNTLTRLTRAGAPAGLVSQLFAGGLAAQAGAIAGAPRALQRQIFRAFQQREALARQAAERPIRVFLTVNLDGRRVATSVTTHQQRAAQRQGAQRRGPTSGTRLALQ